MKNNYQCNFNGVRMGGGSIEHPLSIHSASIGTRWKPRGMQLICTLVLLFTFAIGNVWAANTPAAAGTYELKSANKPGNTNKFYKLGDGVYIHRRSNSSQDDSGIKNLASNDNGVAVYVNSPIDLSCLIKKSSSKNEATVRIDVFTLTNGTTAFDGFETGTNNSSTVSVTLSSSATYTTSVTFAALTSNAAEDKSSSKITLAAGYYYIVPVETTSTGKVTFKSITLTAAAKTDPTITFNDGAYTVGGALDLSTLFASNSDGAVTYTVKTKGGTNASIVGTSFSASAAGTAVVTASQAATSTYNAATKDANIVVSVPSTPTHSISYTNLKGSDVSTYPTEYYEGTGIASFAPLADVANFHFTGWDPATISDTEDQNVEVEAQWVDAYNVSFSAGAGSGTVPTTFQKWDGATFNLPGQGSMTAPTGKVFDGWKANGAGDKLAADAEYTMGGAEVEFVAQWKAVPQTIFDWTFVNNSDISSDKTDLSNATYGTMTTGTSILGRIFGSTSIAKNSSGYKLQSADACFEIQGTYDFMEGDTIKISVKGGGSGERGLAITPSSASSVTEGALVTSMVDGSVNGVCTAILTSTEEGAKIRVFQYNGKNMYIKNIKVIRPAAKEVVSTVNTLTDVKVNGTSISDANLASLVSGHNLALSDELVSAPTITFNKHTVITYDDNSNKVTDTPIEVTATDNGEGKWSASTTIDAVTYTVTLVKLESYDVTFAKNGGSGDDMPTLKYAEGDEVTLPACTFTAPDSKEFDAWTSTDVTIANNKFTMPNKNVTITATWKTATPKYHVTYDGNSKTSGTVPTDATAYEANAQVTVLGKGDLARIIDGNAATFYGWNTKADMTGTHYGAGANFNIQNANVTLYAEWGYSIEYKLNNGSWKSGYTAPDHYIYGKGVTLPTAENVERVGFEFDGWYSEWHVNNQGGYIDANKRTAVGPSDYGNASYLASWTALPLGKAQSVDLEGLVEDEGTSANWQAYMTSHGYEYSTESVSLDEKKDPSEDKAYDNWPYQGLKMKKSGAYVQGTVEAGKLVIIKLGHMAAAATVTIGDVAQANATGLDAAEPAGKYNYYYVASESVLRYETNSNDACVLKAITITDPYQVTFNANGGDPVAAQYGHPSVTLPSATNGSQIFLGWFTEETDGTKIGEANESYTPSADITLYAHWEAVSSDARLASISFSSAAGTLSPAFDPEETNYTYTMPYGTAAIPQITAATSVNANAQAPIIGDAATAWGEAQTIKGVAESGDKKTYTITMLQAPKVGVSIIKATYAGGNQSTGFDADGLYAGKGYANLASSKKMDTNNYAGVELKSGETFKTGDVLFVNLVEAATSAGLIELYEEASGTNLIWATGVNDASAGLELPAAVNGKSAIYVVRKASNGEQSWNAKVNYIEVTRPMNPMLTAITIDERAGEIDPLDDKHFNITIPFEADLDALTVDPTIVWNDAHATTPTAVVSNGGEWVLAADGDNTYRIMDKDGDYTDYTITLTRDIKKYTVSYNTHGGTAIEPELVVAGEKLAAAPADPTQEDYIFQGWSLTEDGAVIDITNVTIDEDKTFHAIWLYENPIKLIQADTINTKDFITGVSINTVQIGDVTHKCFEFAGGLSDFTNIKDKDRAVVYNATTDKTKIKVTMYNNKSTALTYYIKGVVEGSSNVVDIATIEVASGETKTSGYYEFNSAEAKNRTIYVYAETSAGNMHFLQVKVIDNGDVPVKKVAEVGYSLNFNKGRLFGRGNTSVDFEGIHFDLSSDYQPTASTALKLANKSISFDVTDFVTMSVTTSNNKTYYVSRGAAGTDNETAVAGTTDFTLTPGKWFITAGSQNVEITNIAFAAKTPDYTRNVSVNIGTLCMEHNVLASGAVGATFYQIIGRNKDYSYKIDFEEIGPDEELKAGEPYIFQSTTGKIELYYGKTVAPQPVPVKGMIGNFEAGQLAITDENKLDILYIAQNKLWTCENLVDSYLTLNDHRAYIKMSDVPEQEDEAPAPGRRRVTLGMNAEQVVTAIGNTELNEQAVKVMIDGQLFIIRGEKMFNANGQLVK